MPHGRAHGHRPSREAICTQYPNVVWTGLPPGVDPPQIPRGVSGEPLRCLAAGHGAWTFEARVTSYHPADDDDVNDIPTPAFEGTLHALFRTHQSASESIEISRLGLGGGDRLTTRVEAWLFDYDADGEQELIYVVSVGFDEGDEARSGVLTFDGGRARSYEPARAFSDFIEAVEDVDHDGRPDIRSGRPFVSGSNAGGDGGPSHYGGPTSIWHSLDNGTFTIRDALAIRILREACQTEEPLFSCYEEQDHDTRENSIRHRLACRLILGVPLQEVQNELRREFPIESCVETEMEARGIELPADLDPNDRAAVQAAEAARARARPGAAASCIEQDLNTYLEYARAAADVLGRVQPRASPPRREGACE